MSVLGTLDLRGPAGEPVDFRRLLASHGVATLAPNTIDLERWTLETTVQLDGGAESIRVSESEAGVLRVESTSTLRGARAKRRVLDIARHLLRLEDDLSGFYERAAKDRSLVWVTGGAGRMLRSQTVFEDVVKTIVPLPSIVLEENEQAPDAFAHWGE